MRAALAGVLLLTALVCAPVAVADEALQTSGSVVYAWHGDTSRGCVKAGVCGVHGALVIDPQGGADLSRLGASNGQISFNTDSATVRVQDGDGGTCVDQADSNGFDAGPLEVSWRPSGSASATFGTSLSSGRCAGPLATELAAVPLRGRRSGGSRPSLDFHASVPFAAGPYSGTLESTLRLVPGSARPFSSSISGSFSGSFFGGGGPGNPPSQHKALVEQVDLRYRVAMPSSQLSVSFAGESGPFCAALDSCGTSGSLALSFPSQTTGLELFASRVVRAAVGRGKTIGDFRAGRLGFAVGTPVDVSGGQLGESLNGTGRAGCADAVPLPPETVSIGPPDGPSRGSVVPVTLIDFSGTDVLRTHCPGPEFGDVFGSGQTFARLRIPVRQLLRRRSVITLGTGGTFSGPGYGGTRGGGVRLELSLLKVVAGTRSEMVP